MCCGRYYRGRSLLANGFVPKMFARQVYRLPVPGRDIAMTFPCSLQRFQSSRTGKLPPGRSFVRVNDKIQVSKRSRKNTTGRLPGNKTRTARRARAARRRSPGGKPWNWGRPMPYRSRPFGRSCSSFTGCLAVALLGALTHQAVAVLMPVRQVAGGAGFVTRFRAVTGTRLRHGGLRAVDAHVHHGRVDLHQVPHLRPNPDRAGRLLEDARLLRIEGARRDHRPWAACRSTGTSGRTPRTRNTTAPANGVTVWLAFVCWFNFLVGHVVNNVRGFGS